MLKNFEPKFSITPAIASFLMEIEAIKQNIKNVPICPAVLESLRETARLSSVHYSTKIEGNRLTQEQVQEVVQEHKQFPGREREESEVKGYYVALDYVQKGAAKGLVLTERVIQTIHALVMGSGKTKVKPSSYRDGQNVIYEGGTGRIVYMPPEAKDVSALMSALVAWIKESSDVPYPIIAGIAHYQFATIHPYYDGNGRTARLLATLILHLGGYGLKGVYSLEEYYSQNLSAHYEALTVGPSHNYYMGRATSDITKWVEYFCKGMANALEKIQKSAQAASKKGSLDASHLLRELDAKQRKSIELFRAYEVVTSKQVGALFGFKPRTSRQLCKKWCDQGFIVVFDPSKKGRTYKLAPHFVSLLD